MQKITNLKGRMDYISSHARQENLYAVFDTAEKGFWGNLAKENRQEFKRSGTEGRCIEARELIIALPESYVDYEPDILLEAVTMAFKHAYGVECVSALHHNKPKTNYHIHMIFSERRLLDCPEQKTATRNMFYDESGRHVRTKKEILGPEGKVRKGCRIIAKGEPYEQRLFENKNPYFKSDRFLDEAKGLFTDFLNANSRDKSQVLAVYDRNGPYLPTRKIGRNNPRAEEIRNDNDARMAWNCTVDAALLEGVPDKDVKEVKRTEVTGKIRESIRKYGSNPGMFRDIVYKAVEVLKGILAKFAAPPKPEMHIDMKRYAWMAETRDEFRRCASEIGKIQNEQIPGLRRRLDSLQGLFKSKERKAVEEQIQVAFLNLHNRHAEFDGLVRRAGYESIEKFMEDFNSLQDEVIRQQNEMQEWREKELEAGFADLDGQRCRDDEKGIAGCTGQGRAAK